MRSNHSLTKAGNPHQYAENLYDNIIKWLKRKSRRLKQEWLEAALILIRLNLEPTRQILKPLYSPNPRGRPPYDPVCMLRALLLMILLGYEKISDWVAELRDKPRLAIIAGFEPFKTPAVGTFYLFIDRLENGKYQHPCDHIVKRSKLRKGEHLRNLASEKEQRKKDAETNAVAYDSVTQKLKDDLLVSQDQPHPCDSLKTLEDILISCAIIPSANKGLLGNLGLITVSGDGSALPSGANPNGKPTCDCVKLGIYDCEHKRLYSDPTANWGYDPYRDCYYFGHRFYQHVVSTNGHDLPLQVIIAQASETDFTLSLKSLDRLMKALKEHELDWRISYAVYDSGHDAAGVYEYLMEKNITPIIALNPRSGVNLSPAGTADRVNENGVPICPAGMLMRRIGFDPNRHRIYYACPVKRPTHRDERYIYINHTDECPLGILCQPDTKMGPVVYIKTTDDPRLYPPIPRGTDRFNELMDLRSGCERSNSIKKEAYKLGNRPCRSAVHFLVRLYLASILEHAKAWLAEDRKLVGDDPINLANQVMESHLQAMPKAA